MQTICVYCGSNVGARAEYTAAARELGTLLGKAGTGLVYGGGRVGLMGVVADAALAAGGEVIGVLPEALMTKELAHTGLTKLHVVSTMHERKALMAQLAAAFVALPGGLGTMEEFFEIWTWAQLGIHRKPIGLLNVAGFYDPLVAFIDSMVHERFVRIQNRAALAIDSNPGDLLKKLANVQPPPLPKWISAAET